MHSKQEVVLEGVHEIFINQSTRGDDSGHFAIEHKAPCFGFGFNIVYKLFADGYLLLQILHKDFQVAIKMKIREASHGDMTKCGLLVRQTQPKD